MRINFKRHFRTAHTEIRDTTSLTSQDAGLYHSKVVRDVVYVLQEALVGHVPNDDHI